MRYLYSMISCDLTMISPFHTGNSASLRMSLLSAFQSPNSGQLPTTATPCVGSICGKSIEKRTLPLAAFILAGFWRKKRDFRKAVV